MRTRRVTFRLLMAAVSATFIGAACAHAQATFSKHDVGVVLRDGVVDPAAALLYVSGYDVNEVEKINLRDGSPVGKAEVQRGPTALALSADGSTLACVNRLANSVSLIRTGDMAVFATVPVPGSADDVCALPGGGFAAVSSFGDTVTLIDPARPDAPTSLTGVKSVPSSVAASESFLGVVTRSPAALLLYSGGSQTPVQTVPLTNSPEKLRALPGDRFVVGSDKGLVVVDAKTGKVVAHREAQVMNFTVSGDRVYLLVPGEVEVCDATLEPGMKYAVNGNVRSLAAAGETIVALAPKEKAWYLAGPAPQVAATPAPRTVTAKAGGAEPQPAPVKVERAEPAKQSEKPRPVQPIQPVEKPVEPVAASAPSPAAPAVVEAQPAPAPASPPEAKAAPAAPAPEVQPAEPKAAAAPEPSASPAPSNEASVTAKAETKEPAHSHQERIRNRPVSMSAEAGAEGESNALRRPPASPLESGPIAGEKLGQGLNLGSSAGGFETPDWTQPFKNVQGDSVQVLDSGNIIIAEGDARLTLDTLQFAADRLFYDKRTGQLEATGNVEVVQGDSTAWADRVTYTVPLNAQLETPPPLIPSSGDVEQNLARKVLSMGSLDATNIEIQEPTRSLKADHIVYDFTTKTGEADGVEGHAGQVRFGADKLTMKGEDKYTGTDLWLTTCDCDHEYYRIRMKNANIDGGQAVTGKNARLELGGSGTPLWWPRWAYKGGEAATVGFDFDSGHKAKLGYYLNVGQQFAVSPDMQLGIRLFPTTKEGVGFGFEGNYDFMQSPAEPLYGGKGEFHSLLTTDGRGYYEWFHRQELTPDTIMLVNMEQWSDKDFYKDFYYDQYKDRSQPRNFVNVTYTQPTYIATATVKKTTNDFVSETERMPEVTYHLLERELFDRFYVTFDTIDGYNEREPEGENALRSVNVGRLSYDLELGQTLNLTPFVELEGSWYGKTRDDGDPDTRVSSTWGATAQTRFQRVYPGRWGFSGFKHIVLPSLTYSYRPAPTMGVEETPRFDAYDNVYGRSRLEGKIDNILMGRDAASGQSWQVARLSLYMGDDFANEFRKSHDYEMELDLRPRPLWGVEAIAEHHGIDKSEDIDLDQPYLIQRTLIELYEKVLNRPFDYEIADRYNTSYGDYDRVLAFLYYDDRNYQGRFNGRIGFAYTETQSDVFNREIIYGAGYRFSDRWSFAFEHHYDFAQGDLTRQKYEVRRVMQCLESAVQLTERESGWDIGVEFSLTGIPGTRLKF